MVIPASFCSPPAKKEQTTKQRSLPACLPLEEPKNQRKQGGKQVRKREEEVGLRRRRVLGFFVQFVCFRLVSCSPFKMPNKNTNTTLKPYITAFCGVFLFKFFFKKLKKSTQFFLFRVDECGLVWVHYVQHG